MAFLKNLFSSTKPQQQLTTKDECSELLNVMDTIVSQNYMQISQMKEFLDLEHDVLCHFISNDKLSVPSEEYVFKSCLKWIDHDRPNRKKFLYQILIRIRSHAFIDEPALNSAELKGDIVAAMSWHNENKSKPRTIYKGANNDVPYEVDSFIIENYMQISQTEKFLVISPELLCKLIASDSLAVQSEEDVANSCLNWTAHDSKNRDKFSDEIMKLIRLPFLTTSFITENIKPVYKSEYCMGRMLDAMKWHMNPEWRKQMHISQTKERQWLGDFLLAVGLHLFDVVVHRYCPKRDAWTECNISHRCAVHCAVLLEDDLFIIESYGSITRINLKSFEKKKCKSLNTTRSKTSVAVLDGCIYVLGGRVEERDRAEWYKNLTSVERYNPRTDEWSYVTPMNEARSGAGVAVLNQLLYAVGGFDGTSVLATVECYDSNTNKWSHQAPMLKKRQWAGVTAGRGFLYAMGGWTGDEHTDSVERFDPIANKWTLICSLSIKCQHTSISCAFLGHRLFAMVGCTNRDGPYTVEEYDFEKNEWMKRNPLKKHNFSEHLQLRFSFLHVPGRLGIKL